MKRIYVCNDTVTGILSAIYDAWKKEKNSENCSIAFRGKVEAELFCDYVEVEETEHKARAVEALHLPSAGPQKALRNKDLRTHFLPNVYRSSLPQPEPYVLSLPLLHNHKKALLPPCL